LGDGCHGVPPRFECGTDWHDPSNIHIGPDGMKVDPFFNIDLNKFPTGPARGHDMLMN
jgi:hypothetical protein